MTCIVGLKSGDVICVGGDRAVNDGDQIRVMASPKVFRRGRFVIGYSGSLRIGQLIQFAMNIPPINNKDLYKYICVDFINSMRNCLNRSGAANKSDDQESNENCFIVAVGNRLFEIDGSYSVSENQDGMSAIGSGAEFALGSLFSTRNSEIDVVDRVKMAVDAGIYFSSTCMAPVTIIKVKKDAKKKVQSIEEFVKGEGEIEGSVGRAEGETAKTVEGDQ